MLFTTQAPHHSPANAGFEAAQALQQR